MSGIADARIRREVARRLAERFPALRPPEVARSLEGVGFIGRIELRDAEAPQVLRQLYEAGAPPAAIVLIPRDVVDRRAGKDEDALAGSFARFARQGGRFVPTWNWAAFVFGPLWYLRKGLYAKGLLILAVTANPFWSVSTWVLVSLPALVYCGAVGNWDYYLLRVKRTQWW